MEWQVWTVTGAIVACSLCLCLKTKQEQTPPTQKETNPHKPENKTKQPPPRTPPKETPNGCILIYNCIPVVPSGAVSTDDPHVLCWKLSCLQDIPQSCHYLLKYAAECSAGMCMQHSHLQPACLHYLCCYLTIYLTDLKPILSLVSSFSM